MQCNRSNSFSRQSGKTQRESQQSRKPCQSRKSRQQRLNAEPEPKKLQKNPIENAETSSSDEENHFGPDKTSQKEMSKLKERFVSKSRISRQSKQDSVLQDDDESPNDPISFDPFISDGTPDEIPHHLYWDHHAGVLPDYLQQRLKECTCWGCDYGRNKYRVVPILRPSRCLKILELTLAKSP
jgi:hypothetical protein